MDHDCCLHTRMKSARNDVEEKQSLGGWGWVVHSGNISRECDYCLITSREELSYANLTLCHTSVRYRACVSAAKQFIAKQFLPIDKSIQRLVPQLKYGFLYWRVIQT